MLKSHGIALEIAKMEQRIEDLPEIRADDQDFETRFNEGQALQKDLIALFKGQLEAERVEDAEGQALMSRNADTDGWDAELRELHKTASQVSMMDVLESASKETFPVVGSAFAEYRSHVLPSLIDDHPGTFPIELLIPRNELIVMEGGEFRAITVIGANALVGQRTIGGRLFATGEAAFLGASFPTVGPGAAVFPVVTTTTLGVSIADTTAETIAAGSITLKRYIPLRIQRSYEYAIREAYEAIGMEAAFMADLRGALQSGFDNIAIDAAIADLDNATAMTADATLADFLAVFSDAVDAKAAIDYTQVRALMGLTTYKAGYKLTIANIGTAFDLLPRERIRASAHIVQSASGDQKGIFYKTGGEVSRFICPIWRRADILRDPYTQAKTGNVELIGSMYAAAGMTAQDTHEEFSLQI